MKQNSSAWTENALAFRHGHEKPVNWIKGEEDEQRMRLIKARTHKQEKKHHFKGIT